MRHCRCMHLAQSPNPTLFNPIVSNILEKSYHPVIVPNYIGVPALTKYFDIKKCFFLELSLKSRFTLTSTLPPKNIKIDTEAFSKSCKKKICNLLP